MSTIKSNNIIFYIFQSQQFSCYLKLEQILQFSVDEYRILYLILSKFSYLDVHICLHAGESKVI